MKIEKLIIESFGKFNKKEIIFDDSINVVYGENEAGKTTVKNAIETLFYGIYPVDKDKNLYVNWKSEKLKVAGEIDLNNKKERVERELLSYPKGRVIYNETINNIKNHTYQPLDAMPNFLYNTLYSIDSNDLKNFNAETLEVIDDKILFPYSKLGFLSPKELIDSLEEELHGIWRENNLGKFKLKSIQEKLINLEQSKAEAITLYNDTEDEVNRRSIIEKEIAEIKKEKAALEKELKKVTKLLPFCRVYYKMKQLKQGLVNEKHFNSLPSDILEKRNTIKEKIKLKEELVFNNTIEMEQKKSKIVNVSQKEKLILDHLEVIEEKLEEYNKIQATNIDQMFREELTRLKDKYNKLYYKLFKKMPNEETADGIINSSVKKKMNNKINIPQLVVGSLLIFGAIGFIFMEVVPFNTGSITALTISIALGINIIYRSFFLGRHTKEYTEENLKVLNTLEYQIEATKENYQKKQQEREEKIKEIIQFLKEFYKIPSKNRRVWMTILNKKVMSLKRKNDENTQEEYKIDKLKHENHRLMAEINKIEGSLDEIETALKKLGNGQLKVGINTYTSNRKIIEEADALQEKLNEFDHRSEYQAMIHDLSYKITDEVKEQLKDELFDLSEKLNQKNVQLNNLNHSIDHKMKEYNLDEINSEIEYYKNLKENYLTKRNKLLLMKEIVSIANNKFKEENQPDIIELAGKYLSKITKGKYKKIFLEEGYEHLYLKTDDTSEKSLVSTKDNISKGISDQLFLSMRIALLRYYEDMHTIPLFLDEIFAHWDYNRIKEFFQALESLKEDRQIIITTCKKQLKEFIQSNIKNVNIIELNEEL